MEIPPIKPIATDGVAGVAGVDDLRALNDLRTVEDKMEQVEAVARQMETTFLDMMVKAMRKTAPSGGLVGQGLGGQYYVEMLDRQLTRTGATLVDPRFHQALVDELLKTPDVAGISPGEMAESNIAQRETE